MELIPYVASFALGAVVASFAAVVAERLHTGEPWVSGRSRCNSCGRHLSAFDLLPVVSWLLSLGKCRGCGSRVPAAYLVLEAAVGATFALGYHMLGASLALAPFFFAVALLAFIVLYDLRHTIVPPVASTTLAALGLIVAVLVSGSQMVLGSTLLTAGLIGIGFLLMHVLSSGKAMGLADAPVAFALSLLVAPYAVAGLLFSFWIGAIWGIGMLVTRQGGPRMGIEVPFVPFLAIGFLLAYFIQWNPLAL